MVLDDVSADVRALLDPASRLSHVDRSGAQQTFGRLMHGLVSLVLPDQLHAASSRSAAIAAGAPCWLLEAAGIAATDTVVIAGYAAAFAPGGSGGGGSGSGPGYLVSRGTTSGTRILPVLS